MIITDAKYLLEIEIHENQIPVLVLEDPAIFSDIISEFYRQTAGEDGNIVLSEQNKLLSVSKSVLIISDYFSLDLNNRKIQNQLFQQLEDTCVDLGMLKDEFTRQGIEIIDRALLSSQFDHVSYNLEISWNDIFKLFQVKIEEDYITLQEKLISFLRVCAQLLKLKLLVFVNLKAYLSEKELLEVYDMATYLKIQLLLIESHENINLSQEKYYIIDKDKCLIIK